MGCCFGNSSNKVSDDSERIIKKDSNKRQSRQLTLDEQTDEWKSLIASLLANKELNAYAQSKERQEFKSVREIGEHLAKCAVTQTDVDRAWLVYVWVTENIAYDCEDFMDEKENRGDVVASNAHTAFATGVSICAGYADLYKELCAYLGVQCVTISGYAKGFNYKIGTKMSKENHSWNAVLCDKKWRFVDSTWGAGFVTNDFKFVKNFKPYYFGTPPWIFNETHYSQPHQGKKSSSSPAAVAAMMNESSSSSTRKISLQEFEHSHANTLDYHVLGLKCLTLGRDELVNSMIRAHSSPLVVEYTSSQRLLLKAKLFEVDVSTMNNVKIKNACLIQSDFLSSKNFKYCIITEIPQKDKHYLLVLSGVNKESSLKGASYPELTKYTVVLDSNAEVNKNNIIPHYNLSYDYHIKLKSHFTQLIEFEQNPLHMEFVVPNTSQAMFKLTKRDETPVENSVLAQRTPDSASSMVVDVAVPCDNETYFLKLYARQTKDASTKNFTYVTQFQLCRTHANLNTDMMKFCTLFNTEFKCCIYSPTEYYLGANKPYEFRCYVQDAFRVALECDKKWSQLSKATDDGSEPNTWVLKKSFSGTKGKLTLFAQFGENKSYSGICCYEIVA